MPSKTRTTLQQTVLGFAAIGLGAILGHGLGLRVARPLRDTLHMPTASSDAAAAEQILEDASFRPAFHYTNIVPGIATGMALRTIGIRNPLISFLVAFGVNLGLTAFGDTSAARYGRTLLKRISPLGPLVG